MTTRKFTIIDSDTQRTQVIESNAETVADLKRDLRAAGFVVEGKTIQEGISRIEFKSDDAVLPHDVPRNGTVTNDLVFRLTKSQKNIRSGAELSRPEAYAKVKELGLGDVIKAKYGKNFTQCSTADLNKEIAKVLGGNKEEKKAAKPAAPAEKPANEEAGNKENKPGKTGSDVVVNAIITLTTCLVENGSLGASDANKIAQILGAEIKSTANTIYSQAELDKMFAGM